jgi:hypothetical protein
VVCVRVRDWTTGGDGGRGEALTRFWFYKKEMKKRGENEF